MKRIRIATATMLALGTAPALWAQDPSALGPKDGMDLPPTDTARVAPGGLAPDFTLVALGGRKVTLSEFRGQKNVVLVFYRGHW